MTPRNKKIGHAPKGLSETNFRLGPKEKTFFFKVRSNGRKKKLPLTQKKSRKRGAKKSRKPTFLKKMIPVHLLVRSFERPDYLERTLRSLLLSDIGMCLTRRVYDDGSTDVETMRVLSDPALVQCAGKELGVVRAAHRGLRSSFVDALRLVVGEAGDDALIVMVDNDVEVKPNFVAALAGAYDAARVEYGTHDMLLTGFNPTNAHRNAVDEPTPGAAYYRKLSCGAVSYAFHVAFAPFVIEQWQRSLDWGVCHAMQARGMPLLCMYRSVVNHIGAYGLNSGGAGFDVDEAFHDGAGAETSNTEVGDAR